MVRCIVLLWRETGDLGHGVLQQAKNHWELTGWTMTDMDPEGHILRPFFSSVMLCGKDIHRATSLLTVACVEKCLLGV